MDKYMDRSRRWMQDAESRTDWNDYHYYMGQMNAFAEIKTDLIKQGVLN